MSNSSNPSIVICTAPIADEIEQYAANELRTYLLKLYGIHARIGKPSGEDVAFLLGGSNVNPCVARMADDQPVPSVSNQGFVLRSFDTRGKRGMIIAGGSPAATMWGVYEFVERLGVVYTLHGDMICEHDGPFELPILDEVVEPALRVRAFRQWNEHGASPESFGLEEQCRFLDQLAKMKFNGILLNFWPHQPFVHFGFRGVAKRTAELFWGWRYPTEGMVARDVFGNDDEFCNPSMPPTGDYADRLAAGRNYMHGVLAHARRRGMRSIIGLSITEFTDEIVEGFREWCPPKEEPDGSSWSGSYTREGVFTLGTDPQFSEYQNVRNPVLQELVEVVIRAHIDEYPEADCYALHGSEFRSSVAGHEGIWQILDERYRLSDRFDLEAMLEQAQERLGQRGVNEVHGDIEFLYFLDELFNERKLLSRTSKPDATILIASPCNELYGVYANVLEDFGFIGSMNDYSAAESAKQVDQLDALKGLKGPKLLLLTLTDDNIAAMLQHVAHPTQTLIRAVAKHGLDGYAVRCFMFGEMDPGAAYLSKISWDLEADPDEVLRCRLEAICGMAAAKPALKGLNLLDTLTALNLTWFVFGFPVPSMMASQFRSGSIPSDKMQTVLNRYEQILPHFQAAFEASSPGGKEYIGYFLRRCEFIVELLPVCCLVGEWGRRHRDFLDARQQLKVHEAYTISQDVMRIGHEARDQAKHAMQIFAGIVRDGTDRGLFAAMNRYIYQYIEGQLLVLETDLNMWSVRGEAVSQAIQTPPG